MSDSIKTRLSELSSLFEETDLVLNEWTSASCLQIPALVSTLALKLNWDAKQARENDPLVRWYVRSHPDWYITRGAKGGIMKREDRQKKETAKQALLDVKAQLKAELDAKLTAAKLAAVAVSSATDSQDTSSDTSSDHELSDEDEESEFSDFISD